jgi:hypothetical protein
MHATDERLNGVPARVTALRARYANRDARNAEVQSVRRGNFEAIAPDLFNDEYRRPVVANLIDTAARDAAAVMAPLPAFNCSAASGLSERAKEFADKRTKIARNYLEKSNLQLHMLKGADQYNSYGLIVLCIEPDFDLNMPRISVEDAVGAYPVWNSKGETVEFARVYMRDWFSLLADYPHLAQSKNNYPSGVLQGNKVEVVKYVSKNRVLMYLPQMGDHVLEDMVNPLGECYYHAIQRPGLDDEIRGAYDDVIWVQLARHRIQMLLIEGVEKSVRAPLVVPPDVNDIPIGPDAVIYTQAGASAVGRANIQVPSQAFGAVEQLKGEQQAGSMSPEARSGSVDASVITGRGLQQLLGGFNSQISVAQTVFKYAFKRAIELAFRMDEKLFGNITKEIRGNDAGVPYSIKYRARKDIDGDYTVDISYGFAAGLDPNRALVFLLQADGAELVSKDYIRRALPVDLNAVEEERKIAVEQSRRSLLQALSAYSQSIPQLAAAGQDPSVVITQQAAFIKALLDGRNVEDAAMKALAPPKPAAPEQPPGASSPDGAALPSGPGDSAPGGFGGGGLPQGLQPNIATEGQGGRPDLSQMFAGFNQNGPQLSAGVSRFAPVS